MFDTSGLAKGAWERIDKECDYEAYKAVINVPEAIIANLRWRNLYIRCVETRGVRFKGTQNKAV
ncbi:MAG TPA: hypothetical protein VIL09_11375 [Microvirga sp.]